MDPDRVVGRRLTTMKAEVLWCLARLALFTAMTSVAFIFRSSESDPGNRTFLLCLGLLLSGVGLWGIVETYHRIQYLRWSRPPVSSQGLD